MQVSLKDAVTAFKPLGHTGVELCHQVPGGGTGRRSFVISPCKNVTVRDNDDAVSNKKLYKETDNADLASLQDAR